MPYSKAHYYLIGLLVLTFLGFWDSYFGKLSEAPLAHHLHGITSTLWILLMAFQSWLIHSQRRDLHRSFGKLIFIIVPLMTAAFALVTWVGAQKAVGGHPFYAQFGQALLTADVFLLFSTSLQIYLALKFRNNIRLHSALMLGSVIGLIGPILSRLIVNFIPAFKITSLETMSNFGYGLNISIVIGLLLPLVLYKFYKKDGWPWLLAAGITAVFYLLYKTVGQTALWGEAVQIITTIHPAVVFLFGFMLGAMALILGWVQGKKIN
jgi:hypothetical protein